MIETNCAKEILIHLGGRDNVVSIYHCVTRLRLMIKDPKLVNLDKLEFVEGVKGAYLRDNQAHIVLGAGIVDQVYEEFLLISNVGAATKRQLEEEIERNQPLLIKLTKIIGDIFIPILPAMAGSGMFYGILLALAEIFPDIVRSDVYDMLMLMAQTVFKYLPVLVALSSAVKFEGNPYLAGALGLMLLHRDLFVDWGILGNADIPVWHIGGLSIYQVSYEGHTLPIICSVYFLVRIEKWLHRHVHPSADLFVTPLLSLFVTAFTTFSILGPFLMELETIVISSARLVLELPFGIGTFLCALCYPISVVLGIQHMFTILEVQFIAETGRNIWIRVVSSANFAMCVSCLAVSLKTKSARLKSISFPAGISAALGVTEPAIFGINFRYQIPFICGMVGSGIGAAIGTVLDVYGIAYGVSALPGLILTTPCLWQYAVMLLVTAAVTFSLTWFFWNDEKYLRGVKKLDRSTTIDLERIEEMKHVYSPVQGNMIRREDIPDDTFSKGYLGEGVGFIPDSGDVIAPFDGSIVTVTPTKHAIILEGPQGVQVLIHIGINTVELDGTDFDILVQEGDTVKLGQKIMHFNLDGLIDKQCNINSAVVVINSGDYKNIRINSNDHISFGEILFEVDA